MGRALLTHRVIPETDRPGNKNIVAGGTCEVLHKDGSGDPYPAPLYATPSGGSPLPSNVLTADSSGLVYAYTDLPDFAQLSVQGATTMSWFQPDPSTITLGTGPYPEIDVTLFGALGDGTTDDAAAIQAAIDAAPEAGGVIYFPGGPGASYLIDSTSGSFNLTYLSNGGTGAHTTAAYRFGLQLKSNLTLRSDGATILRGPSLTSTDMTIAATAAVDRVTVSDIVLDHAVTSLATNAARGTFSLPLYFRCGSTNITIDRVRFINIGVQPAFQIGTNANQAGYSLPGPTETVQSDNVTLSHCTFERSMPALHTIGGDRNNENGSSCLVWNSSHVLLDSCRWFSTLTGAAAAVNGCGIYAGSITACNTTTPMTDLRVVNCEWFAAADTALFIRGVQNTLMKHVIVDACTYSDGGKMIEKGWCSISSLSALATMYHVTVSNNMIRNWGYYNAAGGVAQLNAAPALEVGNANTQGVTIIGNTFDGAASDGSLPWSGQTAPNGRSVGISVKTTIGLTIIGNTIQNLGGPAIFLQGGDGAGTIAVAGISRFAISNNIILNCCRKSTNASSFIDSGIEINDFTSNGTIIGNTIGDCGATAGAAAAVWSAGIGVLGTTSGAIASTVSSLLIANNVCRDGQVGGSRVQNYGIRLGFPGIAITQQPFGCTVVDNDCSNNATAGVFADTSYGANTRSYHIENNRGWQSIAAVASSMTGSIGAGTTVAQNITGVVGATVGDIVFASADAVLPTGLVLSAQVTVANQVTCFLSNVSAGAITGPACNLRIRVAHRNLA